MTYSPVRQNPIEPLTLAQIAELHAELEEDRIVEVDGELYDADDLHLCDTCRRPTPDACDLNDEGECDDCAAETADAREEIRLLRMDFQSAVL